MAAWLHGVVLTLVALSVTLSIFNGIASPLLFWGTVPLVIMWGVSAIRVRKQPALKLDADNVYWSDLLFPWLYRSNPRSQFKRLERTVVDGQIVRYVAYTHDGDEVLLPTAPRIEHAADVEALDTFMRQHFAELLPAPQGAA